MYKQRVIIAVSACIGLTKKIKIIMHPYFIIKKVGALYSGKDPDTGTDYPMRDLVLNMSPQYSESLVVTVMLGDATRKWIPGDIISASLGFHVCEEYGEWRQHVYADSVERLGTFVPASNDKGSKSND